MQEYAKMVKALDIASRKVTPALWPLCQPAEAILKTVEATIRYRCPMCTSVVNNHPCSCPVSTCKKGLRRREGKAA